MDSILEYVKKLLGVNEVEDGFFDTDLMGHINSAFSTLTQLGVGPKKGFGIEDSNTQWTDYPVDESLLGFVKDYIYLKTKLKFDPPLNASVLESINRQISELEWRLNVGVDPEEGEIQNGV